MKCPVCHDRTHVEIDLHSDGFSAGTIKECGSCGVVWLKNNNEIAIIFRPVPTDIPEQITVTTEMCHTIEEHTKYSSTEDEFLAEDEQVWFS